MIKGDGKDLFRSPVIVDLKVHERTVDLTGVRMLELFTEIGTDGGTNDWSVWLDPQRHRPGSQALDGSGVHTSARLTSLMSDLCVMKSSSSFWDNS